MTSKEGCHTRDQLEEMVDKVEERVKSISKVANDSKASTSSAANIMDQLRKEVNKN